MSEYIESATAGKMWCPYARVGDIYAQGSSAYNRQYKNDTIPEGALCLIDNCMKWEWKHNPGTLIDNGTYGRCSA